MHFIYTLNHDLMYDGVALAQLQVMARKLAEQEDPYVLQLYQSAAKELALSIHAVAKKLNMSPGYHASYSGGLFRSGKLITDPLARETEYLGGILLPPRYSPEQGALLMALRAWKKDYSFDKLVFHSQNEKRGF